MKWRQSLELQILMVSHYTLSNWKSRNIQDINYMGFVYIYIFFFILLHVVHVFLLYSIANPNWGCRGASTTRRHMAFCRAPLWRCTELCKQKCLGHRPQLDHMSLIDFPRVLLLFILHVLGFCLYPPKHDLSPWFRLYKCLTSSSKEAVKRWM